MSGGADALRPDPRHEALLHAALDRDGAIGHWRRWRSMVDFDDIDGAETRLLPLVLSNLGDEITDDPDYGRVVGLHRRSWSRNQILFHHAAATMDELEDAGIDTMLLKGSALAALHYANEAERPMAAVDVLVHPADASRAFQLLTSSGWHCAFPARHALVRLHAADLSFQDQAQLDLHWFSLWNSSSDIPAWERSRVTMLAGRSVRAPSAEDLLVIVCAHGSSLAAEPANRWVADAITVSRTSELDWDLVVAEARRRNSRVTLAASLSYLREEFGLDLPGGVVEAIDPAGAPRWERREFASQTTPRSPARVARDLLARHRRMRRLRSEAPWHPGFIRFATSLWGFDSVRELALHARRRIGVRVRARGRVSAAESIR